MSLISNTDFLIHNLRLSYLRNVEDVYGPRLITFDPSYNTNPYIQAASQADTERWPELTAPISPQQSDDDGERPLGFPGSTSLKHTQTIMGKRTGGLGLRVHGKRESTSSRRFSRLVKEETTPVDAPPDVTVEIQEPSAPAEAPVTKPAPFIPKFKGAAEMEARRRQRMLTRRGPGAAPPPQPTRPLSFSSSSEEEVLSSESEASADIDSDFGHHSDEGDEFDPDFAASRSPTAHLSDSSYTFASPTHSRPPKPRLSPVTERMNSMDEQLAAAKPRTAFSFEVVNSLPESRSNSSPLIPTTNTFFPRRPVLPLKQGKSALSSMLASSTSSSTNPFGELYAAISGRGQPAAMNVTVYFPHAINPAGKAMELNVRKDATMEEVIGFALWSYWEEGWLPKLNEGVTGEDDSKLSAVGWIMRIAEEDGEVDDEFPPPDRSGKISKFNFDAYAVMEASSAQIQQNKALESKIQRRPSRIMTAKKVDSKLAVPAATANLASPSSAPVSSLVSLGGGSLPLSTSLGPSSSQGPQIFLRIRVADTAHPIHISTTIPVTAGMYMQEVLELICRKRKLDNVKDYALLVRDYNILIPPDRTVASLQGKRELLLIKKSMLNEFGVVSPAAGRSTDPNASIFKRMSDVPQSYAASDPTNAYKKYTVYRKQSMMISRQERTLAIDGVFIHIMPATNNGGKTYSYHIKAIAACEQSTKYTSIFKLVLHRTARSQRRFDFEAETPKLASAWTISYLNVTDVL